MERRGGTVINQLLRNKSFMFGFLFIFILLTASFIWPLVGGKEVKQVTAEYENGDIISVPPYAPSSDFILGSNEHGKDHFQMLVYGAKYTYLAVFGIAAIQLLVGLLIASLIGTYLSKCIARIEPFFDVFNFVPIVVLAFFILNPMITIYSDGFNMFESSFYERVIFQILLLACLGMPTVIFYIAKEINKTFATEYAASAKVLGGSRLHILLVHVFPNIRGKCLLLFIQQLIQTMLILTTLGVMEIYFGGTVLYPETDNRPTSFTNEWSGLLGGVFRWMNSHPWMILSPVIFISLTVLSFKLMIMGLENVLNNNRRVYKAPGNETK